MDELVAWKDELLTCDDNQHNWGALVAEILGSLNDKQVELIKSHSEFDNEVCDKAESYVEIPVILTSMDYLSKVRKFVLHKGYTEVLSDITAVEEKLEKLF